MEAHVLPIDPLDRVTGSCYLVHVPDLDLRLLVDCGAYQDDPRAEQLNEAPFPFDPAGIHSVLLTHAHYDHCGRLPKLVADGFTGLVIATDETIAAAKIVLEDAAKIAGRPDLGKHIARIRWRSTGVDLFVRPLSIHTDVFARAYRSSHILGAVSWEILVGPKESPDDQVRVLFSGDIGNNRKDSLSQPLLDRAMHPTSPVDLAFVESTYGAKRRSRDAFDPDARREALAGAITAGIGRCGPIIIPVFGIQRAQDLLWDLHLLAAQREGFLADVPILVDAPMALRFQKVLLEGLTRDFISPGGKVRPPWLGKHAAKELGLDPTVPEDMKRVADAIRTLFDVDRAPAWDAMNPAPLCEAGPRLIDRFVPRWSRVDGPSRGAAIWQSGARIVLATSGMAEAGPILEWLSRWLRDPRATVLFPGHCDGKTLGARLLRIGGIAASERRRLLDKVAIGRAEIEGCDIAAHITALSGYSAHADQAGLVEWVFPKHEGMHHLVAKRLELTHGDPTARRALKAAIEERAAMEQKSVEVFLPRPNGNAIDARTGRPVPRECVLRTSNILDHNRDQAELLARIEALPPEVRRALAEQITNSES